VLEIPPAPLRAEDEGENREPKKIDTNVFSVDSQNGGGEKGGRHGKEIFPLRNTSERGGEKGGAAEGGVVTWCWRLWPTVGRKVGRLLSFEH